jgi:hypothetical protein
VFHWPPSEMNDMALSDLMEWRALAIERFKILKE